MSLSALGERGREKRKHFSLSHLLSSLPNTEMVSGISRSPFSSTFDPSFLFSPSFPFQLMVLSRSFEGVVVVSRLEERRGREKREKVGEKGD